MLDEKMSVDVAGTILKENRIHFAPVLSDQNKFLGVISSYDLIGRLNPKLNVTKVMTRELWTVTPEEDIQEAAALMWRFRVHHLVVTDHNKLQGILSAMDILRHMTKKS